MLSDYSFWLCCQGESDLYDQFVETIQINNRSDDALGAQLDVCPLSFFFTTNQLLLLLSLFPSPSIFLCVWQALLKALSGSVACIDVNHHRRILSGVKFSIALQLLLPLDFTSIILCLQIFGMSLWDHKPHVMDALVDLIISLVHKLNNHSLSC